MTKKKLQRVRTDHACRKVLVHNKQAIAVCEMDTKSARYLVYLQEGKINQIEYNSPDWTFA